MLARQLTRTIRGPSHAAALAVDCLFPAQWLDQPFDDGSLTGGGGRTRREVLEVEYERKARLGQQQSAAGKLGQFLAVSFVPSLFLFLILILILG